jgi:hypothetical protein
VSVEATCPRCGNPAESVTAFGGMTVIGCPCIEANQAWMMAPLTLIPGFALDQARLRLQNAALRIGDLFAAQIDPGWDECQELEAAALEYRNAYRASEPGASK